MSDAPPGYPDVSIVTPVYNEAGNIARHIVAIERVMKETGIRWELLAVDDGSTDDGVRILRELSGHISELKPIELSFRSGKARACEQGVMAARAETIIIMDSDLQYDALDIPIFLKELAAGFDYVSGVRVKRRDRFVIQMGSDVHHFILRRISGASFQDLFSGLKGFHKSRLLSLGLRGHEYRMALPAAACAGLRVREIPIRHCRRSCGRSRYTFWNRCGLAARDIITLSQVIRRIRNARRLLKNSSSMRNATS